MRVAIISDIHDNIPNLRKALAMTDGVDQLLCLGDLCSPFIVKELAEGFSGPIHIVFGNNDGDRYRISEAARRYDHVHVYGEFASLEIDDMTFAINHFDNIGRAMAQSGRHDVVCYGHNHRFEVARPSESWVINPGEIYGLLTGHSTFVIFDTIQKKAKRIDVL